MDILIIEDEKRVAEFLSRSLNEAGYSTAVAHTAEDGKAVWISSRPDLVLLDLMLPDGHGLTVLEQRRPEDPHTPVLVLTAKDTLPDRVAGLDAGADDYLAKPFPLEELLARVRALLRRSSLDPTFVKCADLEVDLRHRRVTRAGRVVFLSSTEFSLLELLALKNGQAVSKLDILRHIWDDEDRDPNVVEVYVNYLRHKLERGGAPRLIQTVRGKGYALCESTPAPV